MVTWRNVCFSVAACFFLIGCGSSSSSSSDAASETGVQTQTNHTLNRVLLIGEDTVISVDPGEIRHVAVVIPGESASISELTLQNAPNWISVDSDFRLRITPDETLPGGVEVPFSIQFTLVGSDAQTQNESLNVTVSVSGSRVVAAGVMPISGGVVSSEWLDIVFSSDGGLENSYELSMHLIEKGTSEYSFVVKSVPDMAESDIDKIEIEHAPFDELYLNYRNPDLFDDSVEVGDTKFIAVATDRKANKVSADSTYTVPTVCSNMKYEESENTPDNYRMSHVWWGSKGIFVGNSSNELNPLEDGGEARVLRSNESEVTEGLKTFFDNINVDTECAVALQSTYSSLDPGAFADKEPVLLIHGFDVSGKLGGEDWYFGHLPGMLHNLKLDDDRRFFPLVFRWQTNARFELVADELATALKLINGSTGKKVHIIAHSFGGLLARTLLQGIALESEGDPVSKGELERLIASVTTIGSPHSGIFDSTVEYDDGAQRWTFNQGFGDNLFGRIARLCSSINCHQLGQNYNPRLANFSLVPDVTLSDDTAAMHRYIGLADETVGKLAFQLATSYPESYPEIPTNVLIGASAWLRYSVLDSLGVGGFNINAHDDLISAYGQLWRSQRNRLLLSNIGGKPVTERYLGNKFVTGSEFSPGDFDGSFDHDRWTADSEVYDGGYVHTSRGYNGFNHSEVGFENCNADDLDNCLHAGWHYIVDMLDNTGEQDQEILAADTIQVSGRIESNGMSLAGVYVSVSYSNGSGLSTQTDVNGLFSVDMLFTANEEISISIDPNRNATTVPGNRLRAESRTVFTGATSAQSSGDVGVINLFDGTVGSGNFIVSVSEASTGQMVNNFSYSITSSANVVVAEGMAGSLFLVENNLPFDTYRLNVTHLAYAQIDGYLCEHNSAQTQCSPTIESLGVGNLPIPLNIPTRETASDSNLRNSVQWYYDHPNEQLFVAECRTRTGLRQITPDGEPVDWVKVQFMIGDADGSQGTPISGSIRSCITIATLIDDGASFEDAVAQTHCGTDSRAPDQLDLKFRDDFDFNVLCQNTNEQEQTNSDSSGSPDSTDQSPNEDVNPTTGDLTEKQINAQFSPADENDASIRLTRAWIFDNLNEQLHSSDCGARPEFGDPPESVYGWLPIQSDLNSSGKLEGTLMGRSVYACTFVRRGMTSFNRTLSESIKVTSCRGFAYFSDGHQIRQTCE